ncbi:hypothetical protein PVAND_003136 [Polypedilum vanderplanki]|uniref:C2H2-type domain-containing protein n=1 Tax=Polypedilum vanderplanki TaxID=319348 RepID=A0A9J6BU75_POLVA|nr:hypothetical protein PVAND_003136 [Polypedilum vanderplanki]
MSCNPLGHLHPTAATALMMKPLMLAKDEPDCEGGDHVSESNYDDRQAVFKSSLVSGINEDVDSDNEVSNDQQHLTNSHHSLAHHLRSTNVKLEAALMEFSEGLNLINKPNSNTNDDNNNTSSSYNSATTSNNDNNNNNTVKGDGVNNKAPRKLFECDVCNMKFSNGANMRRHKQRHTGVKPYECRVCQKRFFRKDHLAEHFTTHTKTLPYHCPICNRGFQRQIAMRAHFQNEHVGQHDLVKTCPLCSYRAGTMKSLRVHFFNRHGIDLDNPGSGTPSSLLLALEQSNSAHLLPALAAAANANANAFSDSGDSARSNDNVTPPMHFLTPHVEISMADNNENNNAIRMAANTNGNSASSSASDLQNSQQPTTVTATTSTGLDIQAIVRPMPSNGSPQSPQSADSNSNVPSSSHSSIITNEVQSSRHLIFENAIKPSISLIPIKQEPTTNDDYSSDSTLSNSKSNNQRSLTSTPMPHITDSSSQQATANASSSTAVQNSSSGVSNSTESVTPTSSLSLASMIKVSPLKSLLREDLKRRITARANNRVARGSISGNGSGFVSSLTSSTSNSGICNSSNTMIVSPEPVAAATTSNGTITSTGADNDTIVYGSSSKKRNLMCTYCGIEFPDQTLYFLHKGCHSESNPWKCNICSETCSNVYEFNSHLLSKSHQ